MSSKSSNNLGPPLAVGRVVGFRGNAGELTAKVASGDASRWERLGRVLLGGEREPDSGRASYDVERARSYRDRLVLKLRGVDDAQAASALRGQWVFAPPGEIPELPERQYYVARLVGLEVIDEARGRLGRVVDVASAGGADLLVIEDERKREILVPFVRDIVREVREHEGSVRVRIPEGLVELNWGGEDRS